MYIYDRRYKVFFVYPKKYAQIEPAKHTLRHILDIQDIPLSITLIININDKCVLS